MIHKLHYFNPGHETAVLLESDFYTPPRNVQCMMKELSTLPLWYAEKGDYALIEKGLIEIIEKQSSEGIIPNGRPLRQNDINILNDSKENIEGLPWGLSPQSIYKLNQIKNGILPNLIIPKWMPKFKTLTSRRTALECLRLLIKDGIDIPELPIFLNSIEYVEKELTVGKLPLMIKTPFSSSGRGLIKISKPQFHYKEKEWVIGGLNKQGEVSIEPVVDKIQDFAMEYYSDGESIKYLGASWFTSIATGSYSGNLLDSQSNIENRLLSYVNKKSLSKVNEALIRVLSELFLPIYKGYLGIDMMIYKDSKGENKIHPCVEINMRNTMGIVAIKLYQNYIYEGSTGNFNIEFHKEKGEAERIHHERLREYPISVINNKIKKGYQSLIPVTPDTHYSAYMIIDEK